MTKATDARIDTEIVVPSAPFEDAMDEELSMTVATTAHGTAQTGQTALEHLVAAAKMQPKWLKILEVVALVATIVATPLSIIQINQGDSSTTPSASTANGDDDGAGGAPPTPIEVKCGDDLRIVTEAVKPFWTKSCGEARIPPGAAAPGKWLFFIGNDMEVGVSTCSDLSSMFRYDTRLRVFEVDGGRDQSKEEHLECVAGADDDGPACGVDARLSTVRFQADSGVTYYILVDGRSPNGGATSLAVRCSEDGSDPLTIQQPSPSKPAPTPTTTEPPLTTDQAPRPTPGPTKEPSPSPTPIPTPMPTHVESTSEPTSEPTSPPPDPCVPNPCRNGGTCERLSGDGSNSFECSCPTDYTGSSCGTYQAAVSDDGAQCSFENISPTQIKLVPTDGAAEDWFGLSVAFDGDTVVVGAPGPFPDSEIPGYVHVYTRGDTSSGSSTWTLQAKLVANDGATDDRFGTSVAIHGDTIVVGAWGDDDNGSRSGSAYVYTRGGTGTSAKWTQQAKLVAEDGAASDFFGGSVAIDGDTIVVGARLDNANGYDSGSAYVYTRDGTGTIAKWSQQTKLVAEDGAPFDYFGIRVAIHGDTIVVGAYRDDTDNGSNSGSAYVYTRDGTGTSAKWTQQTKLVANDGAADDRFGWSVAIHGNTIVVGANRDDTDNGEDSGSAYVYTRAGTGTSAKWTQQTKLVAEDGAANDNFGVSVAIHGDTIIVGAYWDGDDTDNGTNSGSAYVYTRGGTGKSAKWTQQAKLVAEDGAAGDLFGTTIHGDTIVVGAALDDTDNGEDSGSAYVFDFC